jgi:hypothetical protein
MSNQLSEKAIKDFQILYKNCFGIKLSRMQILEKGNKLLRLVELIYEPMTKSEFEQFKVTK